MSDTLTNALRDSAHSSSVLAGIANPAQFNPLAGMSTAMDMAGKMQGLDKSLSERTMGEAYAKSIDPTTGRLDPLALNKNLAADPRNAYSMRTGVESSQALQGKQFELNSAQNGALNNAIAAALAGDDAGLKARVAQQSQQLITSGVIPADRVIGSIMELSNDPTTLRQQLETRRTQLMSPSEQQQVIHGIPFKQTGPGGTTIGGTQDPNTGAVRGPAGQQGLPQGPSTETTWGLVETNIPLRADGTRIPIGPDGRPTETPIRWEKGTVPRGSLPGPTTPGATGATSPTFGTGRLPPALTNQNKPATPAPSAGAPAQPTLTTTGPTQDQPDTLKANVDAYNKDQAAHPALRTRLENMGHAYDALQQMQVATGQGAAGINRLRSGLQTLGLLPKGAVDDQAVVDEWNKYTTRLMTDAAGGNATDLGRHISEQSNPGSALSPQANFHILRNDMGKAVQQMAIYQAHDANTGGAGYLKQRADMVGKTDPRGFVWDMYSPQEQAAINAEVARDKTGVAREKLLRARGMTDVLQLHAPITGGQ